MDPFPLYVLGGIAVVVGLLVRWMLPAVGRLGYAVGGSGAQRVVGRSPGGDAYRAPPDPRARACDCAGPRHHPALLAGNHPPPGDNQPPTPPPPAVEVHEM